MNRDPKICLVCRTVFIPDSRVGQRQKVCKNMSCQLERKHLAQKQWIGQNPDYFKGRYPQLKETIRRRQKIKSKTQGQDSPTIQDELTANKINFIEQPIRFVPIQDELRKIFTMTKTLHDTASLLIYKTS